MIVTSFYTAIVAARNGYDLDGTNDPLRFMVFTVGNAVSLTILLAGGFWYRRRPEVHKRLMLLATVGPMMSAPLAHLFTQVPPFLNLPPIFRNDGSTSFLQCCLWPTHSREFSSRITLGRDAFICLGKFACSGNWTKRCMATICNLAD